MELPQLKIRHVALMSRHRRIARIVDGANFEYAWTLTKEPEREKVLALIENSDVGQLSDWLMDFDDFYDYSLRELRAIASQNIIRYYSRLTKGQLVAKLIARGIHPTQFSSRPPDADETDFGSGGSLGEADRSEVKKASDHYLGEGI